jgi:hypothetical protein
MRIRGQMQKPAVGDGALLLHRPSYRTVALLTPPPLPCLPCCSDLSSTLPNVPNSIPNVHNSCVFSVASARTVKRVIEDFKMCVRCLAPFLRSGVLVECSRCE